MKREEPQEVIPGPIAEPSHEEQLKALHAEKAKIEERIHHLHHPVIEWPKWIDGHVYENAEDFLAGKPSSKPYVAAG